MVRESKFPGGHPSNYLWSETLLNSNDYMTCTLSKVICIYVIEVKTSCVPVLVRQFHSKAEACMTPFVSQKHELWGINYWAPIIDTYKFTDIRFHARIGCPDYDFILIFNKIISHERAVVQIPTVFTKVFGLHAQT